MCWKKGSITEYLMDNGTIKVMRIYNANRTRCRARWRPELKGRLSGFPRICPPDITFSGYKQFKVTEELSKPMHGTEMNYALRMFVTVLMNYSPTVLFPCYRCNKKC